MKQILSKQLKPLTKSIQTIPKKKVSLRSIPTAGQLPLLFITRNFRRQVVVVKIQSTATAAAGNFQLALSPMVIFW